MWRRMEVRHHARRWDAPEHLERRGIRRHYRYRLAGRRAGAPQNDHPHPHGLEGAGRLHHPVRGGTGRRRRSRTIRIISTIIPPLRRRMRRAMAQGILGFMGAWNNYLGPQMFIDSYEWYHMTQALDWLDSYVASNPGYNGSVVIAASVLALLPVLVLFGVFQKTIIGSIMLTGSKE